MKSRKKCLREVYVWELPVRIYHWLNALCIVILCITGFIIADPPAIMTETEANLSYWFGMVRFILLQFCLPSVLGVCREPVCALE